MLIHSAHELVLRCLSLSDISSAAAPLLDVITYVALDQGSDQV